MLKIIMQSWQSVMPFNERARDLRLQNKPLWLYQRDALAPYIDHEIELLPGQDLPDIKEAFIAYRDNLFFDEGYIKAFIEEAQKKDKPSRAAFTLSDAAFREHCFPLSISYTQEGNFYLADLWYYPHGLVQDVEPLVIDLQAREMGYYHVPTYMAHQQGDLTYQVPLRFLIAIDSWLHIFIADIVFGLFGRGAQFEQNLKHSPSFMLNVLSHALYEGKQVLECSQLVKIGKNCAIDPTAIIHGPTTIGDNVTIGTGVVIENCIIGDNVNVSQGCQLMLCVIGDGTFLPFRASLFMTTIMDYSMIAQNTCLQMCVVGRNAFIGAGSTFTDYNLLSAPIRARDGNGELRDSNRPVMGSCVGHNVRIGSGMIVYPARMIESDVILVASDERRVINKDIKYEDSDHHQLPAALLHQRLYPRPGEAAPESW
jgi:UDP-N-acetylglucosamine diphosphorylase / glucose-1-phosphate thymidylyltransferase / UDP-N-acetylgalactosamine diphosphorylase / glucosamine-1-phosphate N-acetyltransferase / galactosamine-1-phosphate N-acetyltransferase